jgi:TfoX/Sxy family transcriptional regulator of competence genes
MAFDETLAERIREVMRAAPEVAERRMFGGLMFTVRGNMACGPVRDLLIVRVGPDRYAEALARSGAAEMTFTGRPMRGFVQLMARDLDDDVVLCEWVEMGIDYALALPPK